MTRLVASDPEQWAELCSSSFVQLAVGTVTPSFRADLDQVRLDRGVRVTAVASRASEVVRTRTAIRRDDADDLLFAVHGTGRGTVLQSGRTATLRTGSATLYDTAVPYELKFGVFMTERVLQVPRQLVDPRHVLSADLTARVFSEADPRVRAISGLMAETLRGGADNSAVLLDVLGSVLRSPAYGARTRTPEELLAEALTVVDDHATDPRTTPESIAAAVHAPLRTVQAAFSAGHSTLSAALRSARCRRAVNLVRSGVPVRDAALRAGFSDAGTGSRSVRRVTGSPLAAFANPGAIALWDANTDSQTADARAWAAAVKRT